MGKKKPRKYFHTVSHNIQGYLKRNAEILSQNPEKLLPKCTRDCKKCPFVALRKKLESISEYRDDKKKLEKLSGRGEDILMAYAGFLTVRFQDSLPVISGVRTSDGTINFVRKSKAPKEVEIGVQYFDKPKNKIFAYLNYAKRGYHFYVGNDDIYCSGKELILPDEFLNYIVNKIPYKLNINGEKISCGHKGIGIEIFMGKHKIFICKKCAKNDFNIFTFFSQNILTRNLAKEVSMNITGKFISEEDCDFLLNEKIQPKILKEYIKGKVSDKSLVMEGEKIFLERARKHGRIYICDNVYFGKNYEKFASYLAKDNFWKDILIAFLKRWNHAIIVEEKSIKKILEIMWNDLSMVVLSEKYGEKIAEKYYNSEDPIKAINSAARDYALEKTKDILPQPKNLSATGKFVDLVARVQRALGTSEAMEIVESQGKENRGIRIISYAFFKLFSKEERHRWKYTEEEIKAAEIVETYLKKLLIAEGEEYRKILEEIDRLF